MKFAPLILLLLVACGVDASPQQPLPAAPTVQAAPANQFGHITPIQLPAGESWDGFYTIPRVYAIYTGSRDDNAAPERYFFSTMTGFRANGAHGTHTLRDDKGIPVLIVKDPA